MTHDSTQHTGAFRFLKLLLLGALFFLVAPFASAATDDVAAPDADTAATAIFGPTIANVPWEYVPDWYKAELAAEGFMMPMLSVPEGYDPVTAIFGPTIANVPWEYVPDWYKAELFASNFMQGVLSENGSAVPVPDTSEVGKETVGGVGAAVDLAAIDAAHWDADADAEKGTTEARTSFMSETGFFFLGVFLIFLALIAASILKRRAQDTTLVS